MISIITPTYNRAHLLPRMVTSVLAQTYQDWELIVMDDGSEDNTAAVLAGYGEKRIRFFPNPNSGAAAKRNEGVKKATGNFIVFLDSDDEVKPLWLEKLIGKVQEERAEVVCCGLEKRDSRGDLVEEALPRNLGSFFGNIRANYLAGTLLMRKEIFLKIGGYDTTLHAGQHTDLMIRLSQFLIERKIPLSTVMEPLVVIHQHAGERIRHNYEAIYKGSTRTLEKYKELFERHPQKHFDYLSVAGVNAMRTNRVKEGLHYFHRAQSLKPFNIRNLMRLIVGRLPFIRKKIYKEL